MREKFDRQNKLVSVDRKIRTYNKHLVKEWRTRMVPELLKLTVHKKPQSQANPRTVLQKRR